MIRKNYFFEALLAWSQGSRSLWHFLSGSHLDIDDNVGTAPWDLELREMKTFRYVDWLMSLLGEDF
jgi:hypothetical protein